MAGAIPLREWGCDVAKKAKTEVVPTDEVVRKGLIDLAAADGPRRLLGKGDYPAIFDVKRAGKPAEAACLDPAAPLVTVAGTGKKAAATLTAAGVLTVADGVPADRIGPVVAAVAGPIPPAERIAFLEGVVEKAPAARAALLPLLETAAAEERADRASRFERDARRHAAEVAGIAAAERWVAVIRQRIEDETADLVARLAYLRGAASSQTVVVPAPTPVPAPDGLGPAPVPVTRDDNSYRRQVAHRLVSVWLEACRLGKDEPRRFIEAALANVVGISPVGEPGDEVPFDGARHSLSRSLGDRAEVRVVRPGWVLEDDDGEHVLTPALVE